MTPRIELGKHWAIASHRCYALLKTGKRCQRLGARVLLARDKTLVCQERIGLALYANLRGGYPTRTRVNTVAALFLGVKSDSWRSASHGKLDGVRRNGVARRKQAQHHKTHVSEHKTEKIGAHRLVKEGTDSVA